MSAQLAYLLARLAERSTWQGLIALAGALGVSIEPSKAAAIITAGVALAGLAHALWPESGVFQKAPPSPNLQGPATPAQNLNP